MAKANMGLSIMSCKECEKHNLGVRMAEAFSMEGVSFLFHYDKKRNVLQLNETVLMSFIRAANPFQKECPLELYRIDEAGHLQVTAGRDPDGCI